MSALRDAVQPVPAGMYVLDGRIHVRRFAPIKPRQLVCRNGHAVKVRDRPLSSTPHCDFQYPGHQRCTAHLYLYKLTDLRYLSLDITPAEADIIHSRRMDFDDVIAYFNLDMPRIA